MCDGAHATHARVERAYGGEHTSGARDGVAFVANLRPNLENLAIYNRSSPESAVSLFVPCGKAFSRRRRPLRPAAWIGVSA